MILTRHQKEIVKKIISEDVYDIPSYLKAFDKGKMEKYDTSVLRRRFAEVERDKVYKVMKKGHSTYTTCQF